MRRLIAVALSLILALSTYAYAVVDYGVELGDIPGKTYEQKFSDVPSEHWAFGYIGEMTERGILNGYPDGMFRPGNFVTRGEFAKIMVLAAGLQAEVANKSSFSDVKLTDWYSPFIETAKNYLIGWSLPNGDMQYRPNLHAVREDVAVALVKLRGYDVSIADVSILQAMFRDFNGISESVRRHLAVAVERGLISGYNDGTIRAQSSITRAEAAALLWRATQYGDDDKGEGTRVLLENNVTPPAPTQDPPAPTQDPPAPIQDPPAPIQDPPAPTQDPPAPSTPASQPVKLMDLKLLNTAGTGWNSNSKMEDLRGNQRQDCYYIRYSLRTGSRSYEINEAYSYIEGFAFVPAGMGNIYYGTSGQSMVKIYGNDNELLYEAIFVKDSRPEQFRVDVKDVKVIKIELYAPSVPIGISDVLFYK